MKLNFKKIYTSANNQLVADKNIINDIFDEAESKNNKFVVNRMALSLCTLAAVFAIMVLTVPSFVNNGEVNDNNLIVANKEDNNQIVASPKNYNAENASAGKRMFDSNNYVSISEYSEYLGIDVSKITMTLPENMNLIIPETAQLVKDTNTHEYIYDDLQLTVLDDSSPEKIITISLSKTNNEFKEKYNKNPENKIKLKNLDAVIISDNSLIQGYFKYNNVWFGVLASGISKDEFITLIDTMKIDN